jgi:hypothetical protein
VSKKPSFVNFNLLSFVSNIICRPTPEKNEKSLKDLKTEIAVLTRKLNESRHGDGKKSRIGGDEKKKRSGDKIKHNKKMYVPMAASSVGSDSESSVSNGDVMSDGYAPSSSKRFREYSARKKNRIVSARKISAKAEAKREREARREQADSDDDSYHQGKFCVLISSRWFVSLYVAI